MASAGLMEELKCSICLSIYENPIMLTCGHNFCENCIVKAFNEQRTSFFYTCPDCRQQFKKRPVLQRNLKLGNIVERYLSSCRSPDDEHNDTTLCLLDKGCKPSNAILSESADSLEHHKCAAHHEPVKYFCFQDLSPLCTRCILNVKHKGHDLELISKAGDEKRLLLCEFVKQLTMQNEAYERQRCKVEDNRKTVLDRAEIFKNKIGEVFSCIRFAVDDLEEKVFAEIATQEEAFTSRSSQEIQRINAEISALHKRKMQIQETCKTADDLTLLKQDEMITNLKPIYSDTAKLDEKMIIVTFMNSLCSLIKDIPSINLDCGFPIHDSSDLVFSVNTADPTIALSYDLKEASGMCYKVKARPHLPERFYCRQVLGNKKITCGIHYWEIDADDEGDWSVGVTYNSVKKSGWFSRLGTNDKSWCLRWNDFEDQLYAEHDGESEELYNLSHKIAILLNYDGGSVSFYDRRNGDSIDDMEHLHTFCHHFTQPLYFGVHADEDAKVKICR